MMLRNVWNDGVATYATPRLTSQGISNSFYEMAGISFGALLVSTTGFFYLGKAHAWFSSRLVDRGMAGTTAKVTAGAAALHHSK